MEEFWVITSYVTLVYAALVTTALVAAYAFTQWEKTQVGRQFMMTKACLALILDYWAWSLFVIMPFPLPYTQVMPVRAVICSVVGTVMLRWLIILVREQRRPRRKNEDLRS